MHRATQGNSGTPGLNSRSAAEDRDHKALLEASANGSRQAFSRLYDLLYPSLVRFIYRYTVSTMMIEEILNDTMLVVWQKSGSFRGDSRVITWILGIASRHALKALRRERNWRGLAARGCVPAPRAEDVERLATLEALEWAMAQLSTDQRLAIEMAYFHGLSCEEMAQVLDCPVNTAKTRLYYGRRKLREIFGDEHDPLNFDELINEVPQ